MAHEDIIRMYPVRKTGIPEPRRNTAKYPWKALNKAGLSFEVPVSDPAYHLVRHSVNVRQIRTKVRFSCRIVYEEGRAVAIRVTRL